MKKLLLFLGLCFAFSANAQNPRFVSSMEKLVKSIDSAKTAADLTDMSNKFQRIATAEPKEWLPLYYAAYSSLMALTREEGIDKIDPLCDNADAWLEQANKLNPNNSEIFTLMALSGAMRMRVNPMERFQTYGATMMANLSKAQQLDPTNPRPIMLQGQTVLYTPEQFGGGKEKALPMLNNALDKYKAFKPASSIHPNWGQIYCEMLLKN